MKTKSQIQFVKSGTIAIVMLIAVLVFVNQVMVNCSRRNITPDYPIFPDSYLISENIPNRQATTRHLISILDYKANTSTADVLDFYNSHGQCETNDLTSNIVCRGNTDRPEIEYFVYIDAGFIGATQTTGYVVQVNWTGCVWKFETS